MLGEQIDNIENNNRAYMLSANPNNEYGEYFLVENRKKIGYDTFLPGEGLLIWHIDESEAGNTDENHKLVDLEEADGQNHLDYRYLDYRYNDGDANDCWVNSANGFTGNSNPNSNLYDWKQSDVGVKNISPAGSTMNADLIVNSLNPVYPVASFDSDFTDGYAPLSIAFTDTSTGSPTSWYWDFGDGTYSTEQNPTHTYYAKGSYTVSLTAANYAGSDTATAPWEIIVNARPPVASFITNTTSGNIPLVVRFADTSSGAPNKWSWSFGDGTTSTIGNPTHTYTKAGMYSVKLTVSNGAGSNTITKNNFIKITIPQKPVAAFSGSSTSGTTPLNVLFTDKSTGSPNAWRWSFGDGQTSTQQNPTHTYSKVGKYTVILRASNTAGSNSVTKSSYISVVSPPKVPVAAFTASTTYGKASLKVTFTDKSTNTPTSWRWNFGDGATSITKNPVHTYSKAGSYTVTLTATNTAGSNTVTKYKYITVRSK